MSFNQSQSLRRCRIKTLTIAISILVSIWPHAGIADIWNLPANLSDSNAKVEFEVDSTWHLVEGKTSKISGRAWLADPNDSNSVRAEISLPVANFDTGSESRDERMREVMHADKIPQVTFSVTDIIGLCAPESLVAKQVCEFTIEGNLNVNGTAGRLTLPSQIVKTGSDYTISGTSSFKWADYGVEDPSILIAKLDPVVAIKFILRLAALPSNEETIDAQHS